MDQELARRNMIEQQVRAWDVLDNDVLTLLESMPRENFVPALYRDLAFADCHTPIGHGQVMLPPKEEGRILQALQVLPTETVLEVGTGTGYMTALLARQANQVYSLDILSEMTELAEVNLAKLSIENVVLQTNDAATGWAEYAPYDVIVISGSLPALPIEFKKQLNVGGRIFAIVGEAPAMQAIMWTRQDKRKWHKTVLYETVTPRLESTAHETVFQF